MYGVYVLIEIVNGQEVPLLVEAVPRYVGMSTVLSQRLRQHASGITIPAERVAKEYLEKASRQERAEYAVMERSQKRAFQKMCMAERQLFVQTAHCRNKAEAILLEDAMTRHYEGQGFDLWNIIKKPIKRLVSM
jgi:predicted GIY-YIG superfamily endonuclease